MTAQNEKPRWLPIAQRLGAMGVPFMPVNAPAHSMTLPLQVHPEHLRLPHWSAANEATYTPPNEAA